MQDFIVLDKKIGQTPLECMETWRAAQPPAYQDTPLTYAGRLDPMASGKLLVLIGEECKQKEQYLGLDKEYEFSVLFGVSSDTGDVLALLKKETTPDFDLAGIQAVTKKLIGPIDLPYPHFSSKTVQGKPLHTWTLEGRLNEIEIPTKNSLIYQLKLKNLQTLTGQEIYSAVSQKIETIAPVTDERKALGNDFRRPEVRAAWQKFNEEHATETFTIATFTCLCSSGTYMRTLAEVIAKELGAAGLAYSIHRTKIGRYQPLPFGLGFWLNKYN